MTNKQHDIFISYSRKDISMMYKIRDALYAEGISVWTDEYLTPGSDEWQRAIKQAIGESRGMVVICSPSSEQSRWVGREITMAEDENLIIFPYWIDGKKIQDSIPAALVNHQRIDSRIDNNAKIPELVKSIKDKFGIIGIEELQKEIRKLRSLLDEERKKVSKLEKQVKELQGNQQNEQLIAFNTAYPRPTSKTQSSNSPQTLFKSGDRVFHAKFGSGSVLLSKIDDKSQEEEVTIAFDDRRFAIKTVNATIIKKQLVPQFKSDDRVSHNKFGEGTVFGSRINYDLEVEEVGVTFDDKTLENKIIEAPYLTKINL